MPLLPVRSAEPEIKPGRWSEVASSAFWIAFRVATDSPRSYDGNCASQPAVPVSAHAAYHSGVEVIDPLASVHEARALAPRSET